MPTTTIMEKAGWSDPSGESPLFELSWGGEAPVQVLLAEPPGRAIGSEGSVGAGQLGGGSGSGGFDPDGATFDLAMPLVNGLTEAYEILRESPHLPAGHHR